MLLLMCLVGVVFAAAAVVVNVVVAVTVVFVVTDTVVAAAAVVVVTVTAVFVAVAVVDVLRKQFRVLKTERKVKMNSKSFGREQKKFSSQFLKKTEARI